MASKALVSAALRPFVLSILNDGESYGYEIIQRVASITDGSIQLTTGSLYPLLHSLENKKLLKSVWREAGPGPKRKYYQITSKGKRALASEQQEWQHITRALGTLWGAGPLAGQDALFIPSTQ